MLVLAALGILDNGVAHQIVFTEIFPAERIETGYIVRRFRRLVRILYLLYGGVNDADPTEKMTIVELFDLLCDKMMNDGRFAEYFDGETKNGMDEWAEITFKSKYEIQYGMFDILHDGGLAENESFHASIIKSGVKQDDYSFCILNNLSLLDFL